MSRTRIFMTTIVIAVVFYDLIAVNWFGAGIEDVGGTVSDWFASFGRYPIIMIGVGYLLGHFFGWMVPTMPAGKRVQLNKLADEMTDQELPLSYAQFNAKIRYFKLEDWAARIRKIVGK